MESQPNKTDIEAVFNRLRTVPANKMCFDCNAKIPTWASVTYGVFICIDCSAAHRSLGVHLSFVRSTQLDTNWTWLQLRQMQLGGNANAANFFAQHNCTTTDAQKKYNSRAAQLYREKLQQLAKNAIKNNYQLHIHPHAEEKEEEKEVDFFTEQENVSANITEEQQLSGDNSKALNSVNLVPGEGPTVNFTLQPTATEERKCTIAVRKPANKRSGLGAKKSGLGATKVKTNFAEIEREAELAEESKIKAQEEQLKAAALSVQEQEEKEAAMRLAYKDISVKQQQQQKDLMKLDPKKAEQMERLGMGFGSRTGVSHSMLNDMKTIEQENVQTTTTSLNSLGKLRLSDSDSFFDDYSFSSNFNMNRNSSNSGYGKGYDSFLSDSSSSSRDQWIIVDDPPEKASNSYNPRPDFVVDRGPKSTDVSTSDAAQKKFGSAKAISSDQFFNDNSNDYEVKANLSRFQGSSSISSSEFFGNSKENERSPSLTFQPPDLDDVRESVRQGVTKVAGKLSSLANGVMSSLQDRYGY